MNEHTHACIAPLFLRSPISVLYYVPELVAREPLPLECVAAAATTVTANGGGTHHTDYTQTTDNTHTEIANVHVHKSAWHKRIPPIRSIIKYT